MRKNNVLHFLFGLSAGMIATGVLTTETHPVTSVICTLIGTAYFLAFLYINEVKR